MRDEKNCGYLALLPDLCDKLCLCLMLAHHWSYRLVADRLPYRRGFDMSPACDAGSIVYFIHLKMAVKLQSK